MISNLFKAVIMSYMILLCGCALMEGIRYQQYAAIQAAEHPPEGKTIAPPKAAPQQQPSQTPSNVGGEGASKMIAPLVQ